jgi:ABC-type transporter Mla MlaB component
MLHLRIVQAEFGDCLILEFGTPSKPRYILIDGGPENIYPMHLREELTRINASAGRLDLIVLSHVDTDHITGLLDLFSELRQQQESSQSLTVSADGLWHNSFSQTIGEGNDIEVRIKAMCANAAAANHVMTATGMDVNSIADGQKLRTDALALHLPINGGFSGGTVSLDNSPGQLQYGNLRVTVLGPSKRNLESLRKEWLKWLEEHEDKIAGADPFLAAKADQSKPNLSSIMLLAEADDKKLLLMGDGRGDHLLQALKQARLLDSRGRFHADVLKMPHHGSDRNVTKTFLSMVTADHYVISANGKDDNPDLATLIWIVEAAKDQNRRITLDVTNMTPSIQKLLDEYNRAEYGYQVTIMEAGRHSIALALAS